MAEVPADPILGELEPFVGEWTLKLRGPDGQPWPGEGRVTFSWHESGAHLVQRTTVDVADVPDSTSIIGCDGANRTFTQLYSDERGVRRIYAMSLVDRKWVLARDGEPFPQRFVGMIDDDGQTIEGFWEKAENGVDFSVDFYLTYSKVESTGTGEGQP